MDFIMNCLQGITSLFRVSTSPLYRYPYRNSAEGLAGDLRRIGDDIESAIEQRGGHGR